MDGAIAWFMNPVADLKRSEIINTEGATVNMCEGLRKWAAHAKQEAYAIVRELYAGTSDEDICKKLNVSLEDINEARAQSGITDVSISH